MLTKAIKQKEESKKFNLHLQNTQENTRRTVLEDSIFPMEMDKK